MKTVWNSDEKRKNGFFKSYNVFCEIPALVNKRCNYVLCCSLLHVAKLQGAWFPLVNFVWIVTRQNVSYVFFHIFSSSIGLWSRRSPRRGHWAIDLFAHWNLEETWAFPRVEQCVCSLGVHVPSPVWAFQSCIMAVALIDMFCDLWK